MKLSILSAVLSAAAMAVASINLGTATNHYGEKWNVGRCDPQESLEPEALRWLTSLPNVLCSLARWCKSVHLCQGQQKWRESMRYVAAFLAWEYFW